MVAVAAVWRVGGVVGEGALVVVAVAVGVDWGVAVAVAGGVCVRVAVAVIVAVGVAVLVGLSVAVTVTISVAAIVPLAGVAIVAVACAALADGLLGASIFAVPIEPSTIKRGAPPMRQPPVQVAPAISISYLPSRAVMVCLLPFQLTSVA